MDLGVILWFCNFMFVIIFIGVVYSCYGGRVSAFVSSFFGLVCRMVEGSKMSVIGRGRLMLRSLFLLLLLCNIRGLIPFVARSSSHLVFRLSFGFSFWLGLVLSSLVMGKLYTSISKLVFAGLPVVGGMILCWLEKLSIFFR